MKLIIVESPAKAKTISHFLGKDFRVIASYGHVRDLPKSKIGIDIEHNFAPHYIIPLKARKRVNQLKKEAQKADKIILASDEDREGEAIAWHLTQIIKENWKKQKKQSNSLAIERIAFHEITKQAIQEALQHPRSINLNLVYAQQARRILDRLVGYELSPFLWKKMFRGLSAGRVQSPALRLIVDREKEREAFHPENYYTFTAIFHKTTSSPIELEAKLTRIDNKPLPHPGIKTKKEVQMIKTDLKNSSSLIKSIDKSSLKRHPLPPFTTSTLQQTAWQVFRFSSKRTMRIAQSLYEGKNLGGGPVGLITYMRTDSLHLSPLAVASAQKFLLSQLGKKYSLPQGRVFKTHSRLAQEAHEAIRPTDPFRTPEKIKSYLNKDELSLYSLIWSRFLASQMPSAEGEKLSINVFTKGKVKTYLWKNNFYHLTFDGFLRLYPYSSSSFQENVPDFQEKETLLLNKVLPQEHSTQPSPRYNDASLVKTLEQFGIGRPSTYAPIISVLLSRGYINRDENRSFSPTEIGTLVNDVLEKHFPKIVDYQFTSQIEEKLDKIAQGKLQWNEMIKEFYIPFHKNIEEKYKTVSKDKLVPLTYLKEKCPLCGNPLVIRWGKYGKFIACSNWPHCPYTRSLDEKPENKIECPKCHKGYIVKKRSKKGRIFYACSRWPECDFTSSLKPTGKTCPKCGHYLVETKTKIKCSNPKCDYAIPKTKNS